MFDLEILYQLFLDYPLVSTDTRKIKPSSIFFALKGDNFDGNKFAAAALEKGAVYAVVDDPEVAVSGKFIVVPNVLKALQALARHHRRQMFIPVIAITGSNGKTTTKELVHAVLSSKYPTLCTKGNLNNHIGVPLTLLELRHDHEVAIIEMGANHQQEIAELCEIAEPTHGLVTNMGKAHLEGFGGVEGVRKGKSELYLWLAKNNGLTFINLDEPWLNEMAEERGAKRIIRYTSTAKLDPTHVPIEAQLMQTEPFVETTFLNENNEIVLVKSKMMGKYNYPNILTAIALGKYFKVSGEAIKGAIEAYVPSNNRSEVQKYKNTNVILDAYNANPNSMAAALNNLALQPGFRVALLGDMLELGDQSITEHLAIINLALRLKIDLIVAVGPEFHRLPLPSSVLRFDDVNLLKIWFKEQSFPDNTTLLIKGSRGIKMEKVLEDV